MALLKVPVTTEDHFAGNLKAPILLVEYGDYECPYCGAAYPIVKEIQDYYKNRLCFAFRNFPLTEVHPHAESAAEVSEFAAQYDRFWEMHDLLFENQTRLDMALYMALVESIGLPQAELKKALEEITYKGKVRRDFLSGVHSGVNGTPTFFINDYRYSGDVRFDDMIAAINERSVHTMK